MMGGAGGEDGEGVTMELGPDGQVDFDGMLKKQFQEQQLDDGVNAHKIHKAMVISLSLASSSSFSSSSSSSSSSFTLSLSLAPSSVFALN